MTALVAALALAAAQAIPDPPLRSTDGAPARLSALAEGRVLVLSFAYARCTGSCPPTLANLARVQDLLGDRLGADVALATVGLDPEDDLAALAALAARHGARRGWTFLRGAPEDVAALRAAVGAGQEPGGDPRAHAALLVIGRPGRWLTIPAASPAREIARAALRLAGAPAPRRGA